MTWVVGTASHFGYSILVSDIRITFYAPNKEPIYEDCLQKIYRVGLSAIGGFSGSVKIGFGLLTALQGRLTSDSQGETGNIDHVADTWWPELARHIFSTSADKEKELQSKIILASAHPTQGEPWPLTYVHKFSSPEFAPEKAEVGKVLGIGSGASVEYMNILQKSISDPDFLSLHTLGEYTQASVLARELGTLIQENSHPNGVSSLFQCGVVTRGKCAIINTNYSEYHHDGTQRRVQLPPIARGYDEFQKFCRERGLASEAASADQYNASVYDIVKKLKT